MVEPKQYKASGTTVKPHLAALSHCFRFRGKERRVIDRNPGRRHPQEDRAARPHALSLGR